MSENKVAGATQSEKSDKDDNQRLEHVALEASTSKPKRRRKPVQAYDPEIDGAGDHALALAAGKSPYSGKSRGTPSDARNALMRQRAQERAQELARLWKPRRGASLMELFTVALSDVAHRVLMELDLCHLCNVALTITSGHSLISKSNGLIDGNSL